MNIKKKRSPLERAQLALRDIEKSIKVHGQDQVYRRVFIKHQDTFNEARSIK